MNKNSYRRFDFFFYYANKKYYFLYGWVIPARQTEEALFTKNLAKKYIKFSIILPFNKAMDLYDNLLKKDYFSQFINAQLKGLNSHPKLMNYKFDEQNYVKKPISIYPPQDLDINRYSKSPSTENMVYCQSYYDLDKGLLRNTEVNTKDVLKNLSKFTNLLFSSTEKPRLGNIEWFDIPSGDTNDLSRVEISHYSTKDTSVQVNKLKVKILEDGDFTINLQVVNANCIIYDQVKYAKIPEDRSFIFQCLEPINDYYLKIWKKHSDGYKLWYMFHGGYIADIILNANMVHGKFRNESKRLSETRKSNHALKDRIDDIENVDAYTSHKISISDDHQSDPWTPITKSILNNNQHLTHNVPTLFLPKGHEGFVQFGEWFKKIASPNISYLSIFDPYLDTEAIGLVSSIGNTSIIYNLYTNSNITRENADQKINALIQLSEQYARFNYNINIFNIPSNKQKFHDRYIFTLDDSGNVINGYNLTNSIQSANKNYPLLISLIDYSTSIEIYKWLENNIIDKVIKTNKDLPMQIAFLKPKILPLDCHNINKEYILSNWKDVSYLSYFDIKIENLVKLLLNNLSKSELDLIWAQSATLFNNEIPPYDPTLLNFSNIFNISEIDKLLEQAHLFYLKLRSCSFSLYPGLKFLLEITLDNDPNYCISKIIDLIENIEISTPTYKTLFLYEYFSICALYTPPLNNETFKNLSTNKYIYAFHIGSIIHQAKQDSTITNHITSLLKVTPKVLNQASLIFLTKELIIRPLSVGGTSPIKELDNILSLVINDIGNKDMCSFLNAITLPRFKGIQIIFDKILLPSYNQGIINSLYESIFLDLYDDTLNDSTYINEDLINIIAYFVSTDNKKITLKLLLDKEKTLLKYIEEPFLKSIDYDKYNIYKTVLHKLLLTYHRAYFYSSDPEVINAFNSLKIKLSNYNLLRETSLKELNDSDMILTNSK